jgi:hypothetical protein
MPKKVDDIKQISLRDIKNQISIIVRRPQSAISPSANNNQYLSPQKRPATAGITPITINNENENINK